MATRDAAETMRSKNSTGLSREVGGDRPRDRSPGTPPERDPVDQPAAAVPDLLPSVSLPKGGGAISGLGEKFRVNAATGSGSLTLPLPMSPGRFAPSLSLSYDSGSGNGPFGFGWSLGAPAIVRKTDKGLPRYDDAAESDVFLLAGAEDLVPALDSGGSRIMRPRTVHNTVYHVYPYRPRIEGLFSRIERWTDATTGETHWRTISRENVTALYGPDAASRIADPANPARVFSWRVRQSWDSKGNFALYDYVAEDSAGINTAAAHEVNRTALSRSAQSYLAAIHYGNKSPYWPDWSASGTAATIPADFAFTVVFDFGDRSPAAPTVARQQPWKPRPDPFSNHRAGFEVRTYRRVERILFFNDFPNEAAGGDCLARSLDLVYSDQQAPPDPGVPVYTFLVSATRVGYSTGPGGPVRTAMPPAEFSYTQPRIQPDILTLDRDSLGNLPEGIGDERMRWLDLDGEGLSGVLTETASSWLYKRNLSANNLVAGAGGGTAARARFGPLETVGAIPSAAGLAADKRFVDLSGAGCLDFAMFAGATRGFFRRGTGDTFEPFRGFRSLPDIDWTDPNLRLVDLTGDGLADVFITDDTLATLHESRGEEGFAEARQTRVPWDEEHGPRVVFNDGTDTVFLADMDGDGLSDIVRVRNGETCYWPNLGYGRFGAKVAMDRAPRFASAEQFDPKRIRLADIDGSGTADILYIGPDGVHVWYNQSGNAWSAPTVIAVFPAADRLATVQAIDLLGTGTICLVWSSPLPALGQRPIFYVDLMGGQKPHLLTGVKNNLGAETRISYAPSTRFYLDDRMAGRPWVTRLPFPVQTIERVEVFDWIGRNRQVSRYAYHHGYFDGYEREFRGFGMVEQWDTEEFRADTAFAEGDFQNWDAASWAPPVLTRTWFHTGAFIDSAKVSRACAGEYWVEPALRGTANEAAMRLPDSRLPAGLDAYEAQEACRALKGQTLRTEVYAEDGSALATIPYKVTEQNFSVVRVQPRGPNLHAVFLTLPREQLTLDYERDPADPRIGYQAVLGFDSYGGTERSISVAYPRRAGYAPPEPNLAAAAQGMLAYDQTRLHIAATDTRYTNAIDDLTAWPDDYRTPANAATILAELTGIAPPPAPAGTTALFALADLDAIWTQAWTGAGDVPYEAIPAADIHGAGAPAAAPTRRIVSQSRTFYRKDDLSADLPAGQIEAKALRSRTCAQAFTASQLSAIFGASATDSVMAEGGYIQLAGETGWWAPSGRVYYSPGDTDSAAQELAAAQAHFFLGRRAVDAFGATTRIDYDAYDLLPTVATDAVGNVMTAHNDYRIMAPDTIVDANGNRAQVAFNALGMVAGHAVMGKTTDPASDTLAGFAADLDDATIAAHLANPFADPGSILGSATMRFIYDIGAYYRNRAAAAPAPPAIYTLARETHVGDLAAGQTSSFQHSFSYADGFQRVAQSKTQAAPGPLTPGGPALPARWLGSGWTIYNNKGAPVRQYEPFFTASSAFEFGAAPGPSMVTLYDGLGRTIGKLYPDNRWEKVTTGGWVQKSWDSNDTVSITDPRQDADAGPWFARLLGTAPFTSWHDARIGGTFGAGDAAAAAQDAAKKTEAHAATPVTVHFDSLGRKCLAVNDAGGGARFASRTAFDTTGKPLAVYDALGRRVFDYVLAAPPGGLPFVAGTNMTGQACYQNALDGGARRSLPDIGGAPIRRWDDLQRAFRFVYDKARRQTHRYVSVNGAAERLIEMSVYGEGLTAANLAGKLFRHYDMAGLSSHLAYDFKGNLLASGRRLANIYRAAVDWTPLAALTGAAALDAAASGLLSTADDFQSSTVYDALDRPIQIVTAHSAGMKPNVLRPGYDEASFLTRLDAWLQQAPPAALLDPATADVHPVTAIAYNERGQRLSIAFGNGTATAYTYDPAIFRLTRILTTRPSSFQPAQAIVQDLNYTFDPVGNVTRIRDDADTQNTVFFRNQRVDPTADYTYDATYRLTIAKGREHLGQTGTPAQPGDDDSAWIRLPQPGDGNAMANYTESYAYDAAGNLLSMAHQAAGAGWTRRYAYAEPSRVNAGEIGNRLSATSLPGDPAAGPFTAAYAYDAHGSMLRMPHLPAMIWDEDDRLRATTRQVVNSGVPATAYYAYDAHGQRVRKANDSAAAVGQAANDRVYLGAVELYRAYGPDGTTVTLARETLNIDIGDHPVLRIETRTAGTDDSPARQLRYQFGNHIGSAALELDDASAVVSYEEYFPFGGTSYQAVANLLDLLKRYRYQNKERDDENGLYYYGARYHAAWLGRWTSCDTENPADGMNCYSYVNNNPIRFKDPSGLWGEDMHFAAVYIAGRLQGATPEQARAAAVASEAMDDFRNLAAPPVKARAAYDAGGWAALVPLGFAVPIALGRGKDLVEAVLDAKDFPRREFGGLPQSLEQAGPGMHFRFANNAHALGVSRAQSQEVARMGIDQQNITLFGLGLHTAGDFLPHANETGKWTFGHQDGVNEDGTSSSGLSEAADHTDANPRKALATFVDFQKLWGDFLHKPGAKPMTPDQLRYLEQFIKAKDEKGKSLAAIALLESAGAGKSEIMEMLGLWGNLSKRQNEFEATVATAAGEQGFETAVTAWTSHANDNLTQTRKTDVSPYTDDPSLPNIAYAHRARIIHNPPRNTHFQP